MVKLLQLGSSGERTFNAMAASAVRAFLQGSASIGQTLGGFVAGDIYVLRWAQMNRTNHGGVNGLIVGLGAAGKSVFHDDRVDKRTWRYVTSEAFTATAEQYTARSSLIQRLRRRG